MQFRFLISGCKENEPVVVWFTEQTKSNSVKEGALFKKKKVKKN